MPTWTQMPQLPCQQHRRPQPPSWHQKMPSKTREVWNNKWKPYSELKTKKTSLKSPSSLLPKTQLTPCPKTGSTHWMYRMPNLNHPLNPHYPQSWPSKTTSCQYERLITNKHPTNQNSTTQHTEEKTRFYQTTKWTQNRTWHYPHTGTSLEPHRAQPHDWKGNQQPSGPTRMVHHLTHHSAECHITQTQNTDLLQALPRLLHHTKIRPDWRQRHTSPWHLPTKLTHHHPNQCIQRLSEGKPMHPQPPKHIRQPLTPTPHNDHRRLQPTPLTPPYMVLRRQSPQPQSTGLQHCRLACPEELHPPQQKGWDHPPCLTQRWTAISHRPVVRQWNCLQPQHIQGLGHQPINCSWLRPQHDQVYYWPWQTRDWQYTRCLSETWRNGRYSRAMVHVTESRA